MTKSEKVKAVAEILKKKFPKLTDLGAIELSYEILQALGEM